MTQTLPLKDIKVLEFTHVVMGPVVGLILADLGAEVIHVEPIEGDSTRKLKGFGAGIFSFYSRNKKSLAINLKSKEGREIIYKLCEEADVVIENFGPDTFARLGYGYETLSKINEKLIFCSLKGFLKGPYEKRIGMDEIAQMMGGLAYMTGKKGAPTRAGTSVLDITGGMFGVIGIMTALYQREMTGKGTYIKSSLFETCTFLVGQFMAAVTKDNPSISPLPERKAAWSVYQLFDTKDGEQLFIGIISDKHWIKFCQAFDWKDLEKDEGLATNEARIRAKKYLIPTIAKRLKNLSLKETISKCEAYNIPYAEVRKPEDLFHDPHLQQGNHLIEAELSNGSMSQLPRLPIEYGDVNLNNPGVLPKIGEHTLDILKSIQLTEGQIAELERSGVIVTAQ